jgi:hypothetical protein
MREIDERSNGAQGIGEPVIQRDVEIVDTRGQETRDIERDYIKEVAVPDRRSWKSISLEDSSTGQWCTIDAEGAIVVRAEILTIRNKQG